MTAIPKALIDRVRALPQDQRITLVRSLPRVVQEELLYTWELWARPDQLAPVGAWRTWLILAGRGYGKTRTGAEWVMRKARENPRCRIALVGATAADVRDVMIEGESGILNKSARTFLPTYEPSKRRLTWPNGSTAFAYSSEKPRQLRGPQHHFAWADELAAWDRPETWTQLQLGLRLGQNPQAVASTTPTPDDLIRKLVARAAKDPVIRLTRGSSHENRANLSDEWYREIITAFEGTRLYRQEVLGEVLDDVQGALWLQDQIHKHRVDKAPQLRCIVVAVDPAVSTNADSDLTGIIVVGLGFDGHGYVLADRSGVYSPLEWATLVKNTYDEFGANFVVAEKNNGGDLVSSNLRTVDPFLPIHAVHAAKGKFARAEPIAGIAEQGKIHHVGHFKELEKELTEYSPLTARKSPDRLDALVWGFSELMLGEIVRRSPGRFVV